MTVRRLRLLRVDAVGTIVEAHIGSIVPRPKSAKKLIKSVPSLPLTLDYTHLTRIGLSYADVEPLIKYATHIHIRGTRRSRLQETFGRDAIDFKRMFEAMQATAAVDGSDSSTSGSNGSGATSATTCRRRSYSVTCSAHWIASRGHGR